MYFGAGQPLPIGAGQLALPLLRLTAAGEAR